MEHIDAALAKIIRTVTAADLDDKRLLASTDLMNDLGLDSVKAIQIVMACEEELGIVIPDDRLLDMVGSYESLKRVVTELMA